MPCCDGSLVRVANMDDPDESDEIYQMVMENRTIVSFPLPGNAGHSHGDGRAVAALNALQIASFNFKGLDFDGAYSPEAAFTAIYAPSAKAMSILTGAGKDEELVFVFDTIVFCFKKPCSFEVYATSPWSEEVFVDYTNFTSFAANVGSTIQGDATYGADETGSRQHRPAVIGYKFDIPEDQVLRDADTRSTFTVEATGLGSVSGTVAIYTDPTLVEGACRCNDVYLDWVFPGISTQYPQGDVEAEAFSPPWPVDCQALQGGKRNVVFQRQHHAKFVVLGTDRGFWSTLTNRPIQESDIVTPETVSWYLCPPRTGLGDATMDCSGGHPANPDVGGLRVQYIVDGVALCSFNIHVPRHPRPSLPADLLPTGAKRTLAQRQTFWVDPVDVGNAVAKPIELFKDIKTYREQALDDPQLCDADSPITWDAIIDGTGPAGRGGTMTLTTHGTTTVTSAFLNGYAMYPLRRLQQQMPLICEFPPRRPLCDIPSGSGTADGHMRRMTAAAFNAQSSYLTFFGSGPNHRFGLENSTHKVLLDIQRQGDRRPTMRVCSDNNRDDPDGDCPYDARHPGREMTLPASGLLGLPLSYYEEPMYFHEVYYGNNVTYGFMMFDDDDGSKVTLVVVRPPTIGTVDNLHSSTTGLHPHTASITVVAPEDDTGGPDEEYVVVAAWDGGSQLSRRIVFKIRYVGAPALTPFSSPSGTALPKVIILAVLVLVCILVFVRRDLLVKLCGPTVMKAFTERRAMRKGRRPVPSTEDGEADGVQRAEEDVEDDVELEEADGGKPHPASLA